MTEHEQFDLLLPWRVNGTLEIEEHEQIRLHTSNCVTCRSQLRELEELRDAVRKGPVPSFDAAAGFRKLEERLAGDAAIGPVTGSARFRSLPGALRWLLLAQAAALVLVAGLFVARRIEQAPVGSEPSAPFRTLAAPRPEILGGAPRVRVLFSEGITEQELRELLHEMGGRIVDGPSSLGLFVIELDAGAVDGPSLADRVAALRGHDGVRFAELVGSPSTRP